MNEYSFHCPVINEGTLLTHCEAVHAKSTQGKGQQIENKVCALAHACWMCPARNAFKVGGIWAKPGAKPRSEKPMETPAKLPRDLVSNALAHTTPNTNDYHRAGMRGDDVGKYDALFKSLQTSIVLSPSKAPATRKPPQEKRPTTLEDALIGQSKNDLADTVTALAKRDAAKQRATAPQDPVATPSPQKPVTPPQRAKSAVSEGSERKLTLAERAKLMKQRKTP